MSTAAPASLATLAACAFPSDLLEGFRTLDGHRDVYMAVWRDLTMARRIRTFIVRDRQRLAALVATRIAFPMASSLPPGEHAKFTGVVTMNQFALSPGAVRIDDLPRFIEEAFVAAAEANAPSFELHLWCNACKCRDGTHPIDRLRQHGHGTSMILSKMIEEPASQIPIETQTLLQEHIHPGNAEDVGAAMHQVIPTCTSNALVMSMCADGVFDRISHYLCHAIRDAAKYITVWCQAQFLLHRPCKPGTFALCNIWTADGKQPLTPLLPLTMLTWSIEKVSALLEGEGVQILFSYIDEQERPVYGKVNLWRCLIE